MGDALDELSAFMQWSLQLRGQIIWPFLCQIETINRLHG